MNNLDIYNKVRTVPNNAKKEIQAGRLRGKTDINPMWRIKELTESFGPCGIGWKYKITDKRLESAPNGEIAAFVDIDLFIKYNGEWSEAIPGTGGSSFVANEKNGPYVSDECYKMALTDAISVSCKALGMGADVYWDKDTTKYTATTPSTKEEIDMLKEKISEVKAKTLESIIADKKKDLNAILKYYKIKTLKDLNAEQAAQLQERLLKESA